MKSSTKSANSGWEIYEYMKNKYGGEMKKKKCNRCKQTFSLVHFNTSELREDGYVPWCKHCTVKARGRTKPQSRKEQEWGHRQAFMGDYPDELV